MLNNKIEAYRELRHHKVRNHRSGWLRIAHGCMMVTLLLGGLAGCGGSDGDDSNSNTPPSGTPPVSAITALDGFSLVTPGTPTRVDLSTFVRGGNVVLTTISSQQSGCSASNISGLSVDITSDSGLCEFTYTVGDQSASASATLNSLASTKESPVLPPLSQTMTLAENSKSFDLVALFGSSWPVGYNVDPTSLVVQGGSAQGSVTASGNVLTYTHPGLPVWNRIIFTLSDPSKPGEDAFGALYVTVSDSVNQPPAIGELKYDYNAQTGNSVAIFQSITLNLATLPSLNITEPDGEEWQLVEVQSYSASVTPVDPNSVTNKQFTFQAGTVGEHIVSYIVGDHEAGFATGLIKVTVGASESPKTWNDIAIGEKIFQATPLYSEVTNFGVIAEGVYDDAVANTIAGVTGVAANAYCSSGNHLATNSELELLRTTPAADAERIKYPVERTYIADDSAGGYLTYDLVTGATAPYVAGTTPNQYVICVSASLMAYDPDELASYGVNTGLSDGAWWPLGIVTSEGGVQGSPTLQSSSNIGTVQLSDANVRLNPAGCPTGTCVLEVQGNATTYGQMTVRVTNKTNTSNTMDIGPLTLLQNAKVSAARIDVNNSPADGSTNNTIVVSVTDKDDTPVVDTLVKLNYTITPNGTVVVSPESCEEPESCNAVMVNGSGELTMSLKATAAGDYVVNFPNNALVGGLSTSGASAPPVSEPGCNSDGTGTGQVHVPGVGTFIAVCELKYGNDANTYCGGLGGGYRTPDNNELLALYSAFPNNQMSTVFGWPTEEPYWSSTPYSSNGHYFTDLSNGGGGYSTDFSYRYVSCMR